MSARARHALVDTQLMTDPELAIGFAAKQAFALLPLYDCFVLVVSVRASTASERVGCANVKIDA
ncbi:MAG: hypothetical protein ACYC91_07180 [Solirubrobacteraceae bacterium]